MANNPQSLINAVRAAGGICFIAHPVDPAMPAFGETDISWVDWDITGFTGIELWNGFSELKSVAKGKWECNCLCFFPEFIPHGPLPETLHRWDELTAKGQRVVAVGGSDAHALHKSLGPLHKIIFPYEFHFSTINTHVLIPTHLTRRFDAMTTKWSLMPLPLVIVSSATTFLLRHVASTSLPRVRTVLLSWETKSLLNGAVTLQAKLPSAAEIRLVRNGKVVKTLAQRNAGLYHQRTRDYRMKPIRTILGKLRGWIFSNPIYVK